MHAFIPSSALEQHIGLNELSSLIDHRHPNRYMDRRIKDLFEYIENYSKKLPPPTPLFHLREICMLPKAKKLALERVLRNSQNLHPYLPAYTMAKKIEGHIGIVVGSLISALALSAMVIYVIFKEVLSPYVEHTPRRLEFCLGMTSIATIALAGGAILQTLNHFVWMPNQHRYLNRKYPILGNFISLEQLREEETQLRKMEVSFLKKNFEFLKNQQYK